ncbi:MAG TPA: hypothetical protein VG826_20920 [Pirellulales bacterium]|nr:hypothetical protein [Pirellulales bacterium]
MVCAPFPGLQLASTRSSPVIVVLLIMIAAAARGLRAEDSTDAGADEGQSKRLLGLYLAEAQSLNLYRDAEHQERLELKEQPVYIWQNRIRSGGQFGAVFVWTNKGCPEAVGTIFSNPNPQGEGRALLHELHSLSQQVLFPVRDSANSWTPKAGVARRAILDGPPPADTPRGRLVQLRALARDFSAHSISPYDEGRWELRLLPQPLYRYESTDPAVIDGAVFGYVTSAGTDPEVLLVIEDRVVAEKPQWQYALARFSDFSLFVEHKGRPVWQALRDDDNPWGFNKEHTYRLYTDRILDE